MALIIFIYDLIINKWKQFSQKTPPLKYTKVLDQFYVNVNVYVLQKIGWGNHSQLRRCVYSLLHPKTLYLQTHVHWLCLQYKISSTALDSLLFSKTLCSTHIDIKCNYLQYINTEIQLFQSSVSNAVANQSNRLWMITLLKKCQVKQATNELS